MLKRTFHDLIEIKKKVAKLEKSKAGKGAKKRRRIIVNSSSSEEEPSDTQSKSLERKDAPMPVVSSVEKPAAKGQSPATKGQSPAAKGHSSSRLKSRRKRSSAKASRGGHKDAKALTGIQIQDKFWRTITRNITIATADLLMYFNCLFIFYRSHSQQDRHLDITRNTLE
ncbi:PREDICTED: uncharacterized protein LOC106126232 isoform X1 [Papilio xuthus]|uniref:Uncharacterized protein LOC106126232 isoform X1 n=1 Tax=Papilio xuthus TaxID=66420 RepID=A0AAJ6ZTY8_PAPXU|nr:PREDICTED: uncharacterized protein LOC106126232 isoform X1 [Papilio xuthus]